MASASNATNQPTSTSDPTNQPEQDTSPSSRIARYDEFFDFRKRSTVFRKTNKTIIKKHNRKLDKKKPIIVVRRQLDTRGRYSGTEIDVRSQKLADILRAFFEGVDGMEIGRRQPAVCTEKQMFLSFSALEEQYRKEKAAREPDEELIYDLEVALTYIREDHADRFSEIDSLLSEKQPSMTFELLWTLFPPGTLLYSYDEPTEQDIISTAHSFKVHRTQDEIYAIIESNVVRDDGRKFGLSQVAHKISYFEGARKLQELAVYPLKFHPDQVELCARATERGKKYCSLLPHTYVETSGFATYSGGRRVTCGRVMIDPVSARLSGNSIGSGVRSPLNRNKVTDDQYMLCYPIMPGFSFTTKRWGGFPLDRLADVEWSPEPFQSLVMNPKVKDLVHSMVKQHSLGISAFDDVVKGKGKGLVGLLCGPPGGGKTLTAEAVAEETRRPLYCLSAGELGTRLEAVEERLTEVLDLAQRWRAVVLLDEADVFLAQRNNTDLERNALVSIFLRKLEYYQGILILTTNLVAHCDTAFESRIHFTIHYPELDAESRRRIWNTFISRSSVECTITEDDIKALAREPLNGRQIKNSVAVAESFARGTGQQLSADHIDTVLQMIQDWEKAKLACRDPLSIPDGSNLKLVSFCVLTFVAGILALLLLQSLSRCM